MSEIIIKNIGPISEIKLLLNKVNVIMGPQSSGKSTIAKIISYCQWVEKRYILDGDFTYSFIERFMDFHRISDTYFNSKSLINYKSDFVQIKYSGKSHKPIITKLQNFENYVNSKNIFIPSERNIVSAIPNLSRYNETRDNIMNLVYDWNEAKREYPKNKKLSILNLDVSYFYDEKSDVDKLVLKNVKKELALVSASSGLQSVTPLLLLVDYLTNKIYTTQSYDEKEEFSKFITHFLSRKLDKEQEYITYSENKNNKNVSVNVEISEKDINKIWELFLNRFNYHFSQFIIEEPEQNLFPRTQQDLIYHLISKVNNKNFNHKLLLTTHSPYVLYAINNCLMGYMVNENMPNEEKKELKSFNSWINPDLVSVWQLKKDGTITTVKNKQTKTVSKHYFNEIMSEIMDEYYEMLNYLEL